MEPPCSISRSKNYHVNKRKIEKVKITHHYHYDKNYPKIPLCLIKNDPPMPLWKIKSKISFSIQQLFNRHKKKLKIIICRILLNLSKANCYYSRLYLTATLTAKSSLPRFLDLSLHRHLARMGRERVASCPPLPLPMLRSDIIAGCRRGGEEVAPASTSYIILLVLELFTPPRQQMCFEKQSGHFHRFGSFLFFYCWKHASSWSHF